LYSRAVVGWSMSDCCDAQLAETALNMAVSRRRPKAGLLHHSDRGCQYTSRASAKTAWADGSGGQYVTQRQVVGQRCDGEFLRISHAKNVWETRSIHLMNKLGERSLSTLKSTITAFEDIRRLETWARLSMSNWEVSRRSITVDVIRFLYYIKSVNVTWRRNVFHRPQCQPLGTLRKRGRLRIRSVFIYAW
jgi:hypothetical protein